MRTAPITCGLRAARVKTFGMEFIYTFMLAAMVLLAVTGLFIGVMNDAANFFNSAIASKAAPLRIIMAVASFGIIIGAITSSGMMEVARSGMFHPELFTFREVMILYLSVMLANIILLDIYNTLGLPTSTTVALVFCLLGAAAIMIITLWTSRRALSVSRTELSLSNQSEVREQYGSTPLSRALVRIAMGINGIYARVVPQGLRQTVAARFERLPEQSRDGASYDLIRATVNLTTAAILISIATSMKLPLSTTYVCFMVSMGSSLADRAWGRESAVYRISGVLTVVSGWFITGLGALAIAFGVGLALFYGGNFAIVAVTLLCGWMLFRSNRRKNRQAAEKSLQAADPQNMDEAVRATLDDVARTMRQTTKIYYRTLIAVFRENRKALKEVVQQSEELYEASRERKYGLMAMLARMKENEMNMAQYYVQVVDYMGEIAKALLHITRPCFEHIDNNHEGLSNEQVEDLMHINDEVETIFARMNTMLQHNDYADFDAIVELRDELFESISEAIANQLRRIRTRKTSTKANILYLNILSETKTIVLQSRNLVKSQRYFLEHKTRQK